MSSLGIFQTFMKVFRVLTIIGFVCCVIALAGLIVVYFCADSTEFIKLLNEALVESGMEPLSEGFKTSLLTSIFTILGAVVVFFMTMRYLKHETKKGTPFDKDGAKELFILSLVSIILPFVIGFINGIIVSASGTTAITETSMMNDSIMGSGLVLLAGSFAFKHGAELQQKLKDKDQNA